MISRSKLIAAVTVIVALLVGCGPAAPPTATPVPPADTAVPTPIAPTATATAATPLETIPTPTSTEPPAAAEIEVSGPQTLAGHGGAVTSLAFSPDGAVLASTGHDNTVHLWDVATGQVIQVLQAGSASVKGIDFGPDGNLLATVEADQTIALWDLATGQILRRIGEAGVQACGLEFSPDGTLLASGHTDMLVRLWDVQSGELLRTLSGMEGVSCPVAFSPDGALVASGGGNTDSRVLVWEVASGQLRHTLSGHDPNVYRVVFSPDGTLLASASGDRTAKIWDVDSGRLLHSLDADQYKLMYVAFSPDGRLLVSGGDDGLVRLWDVASGQLLNTLRGHSREIYAVAFSPVDLLFASAGEGGDVLLWHISSTPRTSEGLIAFVSDRDGNGEIYVMNADGSDPRRLTDWRDFDGFPDWSPDGRRIVYYTHLNNTSWVIQVMDADGSNPRQLTSNGICDGAPYWSPDGTRIAFTSDAHCDADHGEVYVMDADGGNQRNLTQNDADDVFSSWSPDSQQIVFVSTRDGNEEIYVMDADGSNVRRLTNNDDADITPAWSPDGTGIAFVSDRDGNREIYVMDADGGNPRRLTNHEAGDWFPRWSPDGTQITFSSRRDGNFEIYVMNADGGDVRRLTDNPAQDYNSVWQPLPAGVRSDTWIRSYEGVALGTVLDGVATADGGYLFVGSTNYTHDNRDNEDIYLLKTDAAGEPRWEKTLGGDRFDRGNRIMPAADGGFLVLGETRSFGAGGRDVYLLKIDADGEELWSQTYGGPSEERGFSFRQTADGGYVLAGQTESFGAGGIDMYLVKVDSRGNEVWSQTYGSELDEEGYAAVELPGGGFLVLGVLLHEGRDYVAQNPDVYLVRTDEQGEELWSQVQEEPGAQGGHKMLPASDGHYLIIGIRSDAGSGAGMDPLLLKVDADGNVVWEGAIGEANVTDYGTDVIETADGGYLLTGMALPSGRGGIPLVRLDEKGQVLWRKYLSTERGNRAGLRILESPAGGYLIIGTVGGSGRSWYTVLIKIDGEGNVAE